MNLKNKLSKYALIAMTVSLLFSVNAQAQDDVTAKDREAAAEAYDRGADAYLEGNYAAAAHWFERAYRMAPSSVALIQAIRAHERANGDPMRIANLALRLKDKFPDDKRAQKFAAPLLRDAQGKYLRVQVNCDKPCEVESDGGLVGHTVFFADPEKQHSVVADFETGRRTSEVRGGAGMMRTLSFEAPPPPPKPRVAPTGRKKSIPGWAFYSLAGATLAAGGMTLWSGLDAKKGVDAYEAAVGVGLSPGLGGEQEAQNLLANGQKKERRTNILLGVSGGLALSTIVVAIFTDFKGEWTKQEEAPKGEGAPAVSRRVIRPTLAVGSQSGTVGVEGTF